MSPLESATVLPCSEERSFARLSKSRCRSSRNLNRTRAPLRIGRRPAALRRLGVRNGGGDFGPAGEGDLGLDLAGIGVEHVAEPAGGAFRFLAADEMADLAHCRLLVPLGGVPLAVARCLPCLRIGPGMAK